VEINDVQERRAPLPAASAVQEAGDLRRAGEPASQGEALWPLGELAEGLTGPWPEAVRHRWAQQRMPVRCAPCAGGCCVRTRR
jgi:hypothetical protein